MRYSFSHGISDTGSVRDDNQDAIQSYEPQDKDTLESHGALYAVADGMGGYEHGSIASTLTLETFFSTFYSGKPQKPHYNLKHALHTANTALMHEAQTLNARMGTTLSALNLFHNECHIAHVGDSRIYQVRGRKAKCLTNDHTAVGELVRLGVLTPDKVRTHERRSILQKCLGMYMFVMPDIQRHPVQEGDYFVLCSDGIWGYVEDEEFGQIVHDLRDPDEIGAALGQKALDRQSDDNLSALVIYVEKLYTPQIARAHTNQGLRPLLRSWLYGKS
jgi:PPM family protein phosphatase